MTINGRQRTPNRYGLIAARPTTASNGDKYFATDTGLEYTWTGSAWTLSGALDHASLTGVTANQHHNQAHNMASTSDHTQSTPTYKDVDYTVLTTDVGKRFRCDCTTLSITLTLPDANSCIGWGFLFKRTVGGANSVILARAGSDTIDGATSKTLVTQWAFLRIYSRGVTWEIESSGGTIT